MSVETWHIMLDPCSDCALLIARYSTAEVVAVTNALDSGFPSGGAARGRVITVMDGSEMK